MVFHVFLRSPLCEAILFEKYLRLDSVLSLVNLVAHLPMGLHQYFRVSPNRLFLQLISSNRHELKILLEPRGELFRDTSFAKWRMFLENQ